jgi:predicted phosphodiesterase
MRIAILSDIHGNDVALEAMLADLRRDPPDQTVCLGDAIQGGAQPAEVVHRLRDLACPVVMGNADDFLLTGTVKNPGETSSAQQLAVRAWQLGRLSEDDRRFIQSFQPTVEIPLGDGDSLLCFHGSPHSFNDVIFPHTPEDEFKRMFEGTTALAFCGGHTHLQTLRRLGGSLFFNPGSVGLVVDNRPAHTLPLRADPWAEYAMLSYDAGRLALEFRRAPYDAQQWISVLRSSGRPDAEAQIALYQPRPA